MQISVMTSTNGGTYAGTVSMRRLARELGTCTYDNAKKEAFVGARIHETNDTATQRAFFHRTENQLRVQSSQAGAAHDQLSEANPPAQ